MDKEVVQTYYIFDEKINILTEQSVNKIFDKREIIVIIAS
jgi:hypothetical protein